jgi:GWxTD domain-containing protein
VMRKSLVALAVLAALGGFSPMRAAAAAGDKLDPESEKFYKTARLIMTGEENKIFKHLPDAESRKEFIKDFWDKRDPDPDTPVNEFKKEFEARIEYANKRFIEGGPGMNTDRGRIYIFMGPPDKFEEYPTYGNPNIRGPILWWIYYKYNLGIEFVDERGNGQFKIRDYTGDFFDAMDLFKLGQWVGPDSVFKKRVAKFDLKYDPDRKEMEILFPAKDLLFKENEAGQFQVDLDFKIYVYPDEGKSKETYKESQSFVVSSQDLEGLKTVSFRFAHALKPGKNFVDVIAKGKPGTTGKVRKIFEIKVRS